MRSQNGRAFTLIEVLVVIAIIALLLTVLLPALSRARVQGRKATCCSNLGQLGRAWHIYTNSHNDYFPVMTDGQWIYGGKAGSVSGYKTPRRPLNAQLLLKQMQKGSAEVFHCPSDIGDDRRPNWTYFDGFGTSYTMNNLLVGSEFIRESTPLWEAIKPLRPRMRRSRVTVPHSRMLLGGDGPWLHAWDRSRLASNWHAQAFAYCLLFLDGHVTFTQMEPGKHVTDRYTTIPFKGLQNLARDFPNDYLP